MHLGRRAILTGAASAVFAKFLSFSANAASIDRSSTPGYELITKDQLDRELAKLSGTNHSLDLTVQGVATTATVSLVNEGRYREREFEWHEAKDHIFLGLRGETVYEVGGSPGSPYKISNGEWRAPRSEGAVAVTLRPGDLLTIARGTPHRESTERGASFLLISPAGSSPNP